MDLFVWFPIVLSQQTKVSALFPIYMVVDAFNSFFVQENNH